MAIYVEWVFPDQVGRHRLVNVRFHRLRAKKGFAETDDTFVRMNSHPDDIGEFSEPNCFDFGDFHV